MFLFLLNELQDISKPRGGRAKYAGTLYLSLAKPVNTMICLFSWRAEMQKIGTLMDFFEDK